jgi:superfamily II DNA helicase RecQ
MKFTSEEVKLAYKKVQEHYSFPYDLKPEQLLAIHDLVNRLHTFVVLPTGFGKTDVFILTALILDVLEPGKKHCVLCIIPLVAYRKIP